MMKKLICLVLILVISVGCLSACNFTRNMSGVVAGDPKATPEAEEMMLALAEDRISDGKSLMHPQLAEKSEDALVQMRDYLAGRKVRAMEQISINVNTSTGTSGSTRQERVGYKVTLDDGGVIYINAVYLSDNLGTGFASFQLVLGVV